MSKAYTSVFEIIKDTEFYVTLVSGAALNVSYFQQIVQNRWPWMVANWNQLYKRFNTFANGDDTLLSKLESLNQEVIAYNIGSKTNPFTKQDKVIQFDVFLELINLSELNLTPDEKSYINNQTQITENLQEESFQNAINFLRKEQAILAQTIGLGDPDEARLLGITVISKKREPSIDDLAQIDEIQNLMNIIEGIIYNLQLTTKRPPNLLQFGNDSITPQSAVSLVDTYRSYENVPFSISLEDMAQQYLGSKDRWYELVTVNKLQPPYVDEQGYKLSLLSNAALNSVIISSEQQDILFVGQKIGIGSNKFREESRVVERIILNENNTMVVFVSGLRDLSKYTTAQGGFVRVYKPATTRRGQFILIPSTTPGFSPLASKTPSSDVLQRLSAVFKNFGIDIYHDETSGDFQFDPNGNFQYAFGLTNVRQATLNAMKTERGELPFHPSYGVDLGIGDRFYGTTDEALLFGVLIRDSILRDGRFTNALLSNVVSTGTSISIKIVVYLDGTNQPVTLSFIA